MTAQDLLGMGVIDEIIREPDGGAHLAPSIAIQQTDEAIWKHLTELSKEKGSRLVEMRYRKFRHMGEKPPG